MGAGIGIAPDFISIQNETDFVPPDWEGCKFTPSETAEYPGYDQALEAVASSLPSDAPAILGPETLGVHYSKVQSYAAAMDTSLLYGFAEHLYESGDDGVWDWDYVNDAGPDSFVGPMRGAASVMGDKPGFMTEFGTEGGDYGGFSTAWLIHNSLAEANLAAFIYWDLIWVNNSGLVSLDDTSYTINDEYYAMRHFSYFTDPGDIRVQAYSNMKDIRATAWKTPLGDQLVVVLLNVGDVETTVALSDCDTDYTVNAAVRTTYGTTTADMTAWEDIANSLDTSEILMPAKSQATVVLSI